MSLEGFRRLGEQSRLRLRFTIGVTNRVKHLDKVVRVYSIGSVARDEATRESDTDALFVVRRRSSIKSVNDLLCRVSDNLNPFVNQARLSDYSDKSHLFDHTVITERDFHFPNTSTSHGRFIHNVKKEAILIYQSPKRSFSLISLIARLFHL